MRLRKLDPDWSLDITFLIDRWRAKATHKLSHKNVHGEGATAQDALNDLLRKGDELRDGNPR